MIFYEDFDLRVQSDGDQFTVRAQSGTKVATEHLEIDPFDFRGVVHLEGATPNDVRRCGAELFDALIRGRVRDLYEQARGHVDRDPTSGLRIRLIFDPRDERIRPLIRLPWEILRDRSDDINDAPALDSRRPVVRTLDSAMQQLTPADGPLKRVLLAVGPIGWSQADLRNEQAAVVTALARISIEPAVIPNVTRNSLFEAVADSNAQIVHFMGHCDLDPETDEGVLCLEDDHGNEDRLPGSEFAGFFIGKPAPRLLILTSCLSAAQGDGPPFAGIAFALVAAGLPAVVAMQSKVRDDTAIRFTERLYRCLSDGTPVEAAVADARRALRIRWPNTVEWASPVLFMRDEPASVRPKEPEKPTIPIQDRPAVSSGNVIVTNHVEYQNNFGAVQALTLNQGQKGGGA